MQNSSIPSTTNPSVNLAHQVSSEALGQSDAFLQFQERLSAVASVDRPVLLIGERGTGKELAAWRLHFLSRRWEYPFVTLNCSALSPSLIESELFGHLKGAFTGASRERIGRFSMANLGTLFLDEVGNIPLQAQEKILRVVEYGTYEPVGSSTPIQTDVRVIAATNVDLSEKAEKGLFMRDLLDRLAFEVLHLPPLRERKGDIPLLAHHFAARMALEIGREDIPRFSQQAMATLEAYDWPGNIRELKNAVERAVYRSASAVIRSIIFNPFQNPYAAEEKVKKTTGSPSALKPSSRISAESDTIDKPLDQAVWEFKVRLLENALIKSNFNQQKASQVLGMTYHQFRALYRKYKALQDRVEEKAGRAI
jgi:psp operon transcriptional activator